MASSEKSMSVNVLENTNSLREILGPWLANRLPTPVWQSLSAEFEEIHAGADDREVFKLFSLLPRRVGKADLKLTVPEMLQARQSCLGWNPIDWTVDQTARSLLLLSLPQTDEVQIQHRFTQLFTTSGLQELIALHQTLPLLPHPDRYRFWADEGIRSHMTGVFKAIALNNPYPATHFDEAAWNQLVLKAIFIDSPLAPIYGLTDRANPTLARMLIDYAQERWAAGRRMTPEAWQLIAPFVTEGMLPDLRRALSMDDQMQQDAIIRACQSSSSLVAQALVHA
jgi:hypothetical protein